MKTDEKKKKIGSNLETKASDGLRSVERGKRRRRRNRKMTQLARTKKNQTPLFVQCISWVLLLSVDCSVWVGMGALWTDNGSSASPVVD